MQLKRNIRLLTWFNFFTDFRLYAPIAIIYFSRVSHSYALGASVFSITYIVSAIMDIPTGIFADRIGRKRSIVFGAVTAVLFAIFYAIGINFWFLAIGAFFEGLSRAFYSGNNQALLHNMLSEEGLEEEYHIYSGKLNAMFQAALAISALAGAIIANWSFPLVMWLSVIPQTLCLIISIQITETKKANEMRSDIFSHLKEAIRLFRQNPKLRLLNLTNILSFGVGETSYQFQAAFYNLVLPLWAVGVAKSLSNVLAFFGYQLSGKVISRYKAINVLIFGEVYGRVINFIALLFPTPISPFLMTTTSIFHGTGSTASDTLLQQEFSDKQRATMSSLNSFGGSLFFGIFAYITGLLADKIGPIKTLLIVQLVYLPSLWLLWKLYHLSKRDSHE